MRVCRATVRAMALLTCPECKHQLSSLAPACPHCGAPNAYQAAAIAAVRPDLAKPSLLLRAAKATWRGIVYAAPIVHRKLGRNGWIGVGFAALGLAVLGYGYAKAQEAQDAAERRAYDAKAERERLAYVAKAEAERAAAAKAAKDQAAAEAAEVQAHRAKISAETGAMNAAQRYAWARSCMSSPTCTADDVRIAAAAAPEAERAGLLKIVTDEADRAALESSASVVARLAQRGRDGTEQTPDAIGGTLGALSGNAAAILRKLPATTLGEAAKSPATSRGKVITAGGTVAGIHCESGLCDGTLAADASYVYFLTREPTDGITSGSWASFKGVFVQEYAYPNVSGGQTRSQLLVGMFQR
jgi:zinc-ribbon domain